MDDKPVPCNEDEAAAVAVSASGVAAGGRESRRQAGGRRVGAGRNKRQRDERLPSRALCQPLQRRRRLLHEPQPRSLWQRTALRLLLGRLELFTVLVMLSPRFWGR